MNKIQKRIKFLSGYQPLPYETDPSTGLAVRSVRHMHRSGETDAEWLEKLERERLGLGGIYKSYGGLNPVR